MEENNNKEEFNQGQNQEPNNILNSLPEGVQLRRIDPVVVSYGRAKELKRLGLDQKASFWYVNRLPSVHTSEMVEHMCEIGMINPDTEMVAAYSLDQMVAVLGSCATSLAMGGNPQKYEAICMYRDGFSDQQLKVQADTYPNAVANMVIEILSKRKKPLEEANRWLVAIS